MILNWVYVMLLQSKTKHNIYYMAYKDQLILAGDDVVGL
jgi:hypothetical protein